MKDKIFGVFGASGFGREVMPLVRNMAAIQDIELVFVDDNPPSKQLNGHRVLTYDQFLTTSPGGVELVVAIADGKIRKLIEERCNSDGVTLRSVTAQNVVMMDEVSVGLGTILCPFVTLTSNITIGKSFHANIYSYVAHDCVIGDYVTFAPAVRCNGNIEIKDGAYIGTGAIIKQGRPGKPLIIGENAVVGMGAVVTKDVPAGTVVVGNPARPLVRS